MKQAIQLLEKLGQNANLDIEAELLKANLPQEVVVAIKSQDEKLLAELLGKKIKFHSVIKEPNEQPDEQDKPEQEPKKEINVANR